MKHIATINLASESIYHNSVAIDDYDAGEDSQVDLDLCYMHIKKKKWSKLRLVILPEHLCVVLDIAVIKLVLKIFRHI